MSDHQSDDASQENTLEYYRKYMIVICNASFWLVRKKLKVKNIPGITMYEVLKYDEGLMKVHACIKIKE